MRAPLCLPTRCEAIPSESFYRVHSVIHLKNCPGPGPTAFQARCRPWGPGAHGSLSRGARGAAHARGTVFCSAEDGLRVVVDAQVEPRPWRSAVRPETSYMKHVAGVTQDLAMPRLVAEKHLASS